MENRNRSVDDEKSDFCKLANRMMYKMFQENVPEELPDWSGLENRIELVTKKKYVGNFRTETKNSVWQSKESVRVFLKICEELKAGDFDALEKMFAGDEKNPDTKRTGYKEPDTKNPGFGDKMIGEQVEAVMKLL